MECRDTSIEAWEGLDLTTLQKNTYQIIYERGEHGATGMEITTLLDDGRQYHQRPGELERLGHIVDSGKRRKNPSGRLAIVWIAKTLQLNLPL